MVTQTVMRPMRGCQSYDLAESKCGGAFAGGCLRSLASGWLNRKDYAIPCGTLLVNLAGSLLVGIMLGVVAMGSVAEPWKALLITGFCGGLTTFSTFTSEVVSLFEEHSTVRAWIYWIGSVVAGICCVAFGFLVTRAFA